MRRAFVFTSTENHFIEPINRSTVFACSQPQSFFSHSGIRFLLACLGLFAFLVIPVRSQDGRKVVTNIDYVIRNSTASSNPCPAGWEWSSTDLNKTLNFRSGALTAGKYIYLCYQREDWTASVSPITDIDFTTSEDDGNLCPEGWTWIPKDLNDGAGGDTDYIYTCYKRGGKSPIFDLKAVDGFLGFAGCGTRWHRHPADLNAGTSFTEKSPYPTADVFMCFQDVKAMAEMYDCGGEGERPCGSGTRFFSEETAFWGNGNFGCDRGLREIDGKCKNAGNALSRRHSDVDDFQGSWTQWAMKNQRNQLAMDEPLNWVTTLGAHNGFNNLADAYFVDPNQKFSFTDQLRLGVRNINPDLVWFNNQLRLCHGTPSFGCSPTDRYYFNAIKEIATWLDENPDEIITISFEDRFEVGHDNDEIYIWGPISVYLGDKVLKRSEFAEVVPSCVQGGEVKSFNECRWPTRREMLKAGKQVIIFGSGEVRATDWVWTKHSLAGKGSSATSFNYDQCNTTDESHFWDGIFANWNGVSEDRTALTTLGAGLGRAEWVGFIDEDRMEKLVRCGVASISLDFLHAAGNTQAAPCGAAEENDDLSNPCPDTDNRLKKAVWSWAENDGGNFGDRALYASSVGNWVSRTGTAERHHFACSAPREGIPQNWFDQRGSQWRVTNAIGFGHEGNRICEQEFGSEGLVFAVPVNGFQNEQMKAALAEARNRAGFDSTSSNVWMNYRKGAGQNWIRDRGPQVALSGVVNIREGDTVTYRFQVSDDGIDDDAGTSFNFLSADCGAFAELVPGSQIITQQGGQFDCRFVDNKAIRQGNSNVTVRVANTQDVIRTASFATSVSNVAPALSNITLTSQIDENGTTMLTGMIIDPGVRDSFVLSVKWHPSETAQIYNYPAGTTSFQLTRQYLDDDPTNSPSDSFLVSLIVADDSNDNSDLRHLPLTVTNITPVVSMTLAGLYRTGAGSLVVPTLIPISVSGNFTDVGMLDTHTQIINWGDGSSVSHELTGTHAYTTAGQFTVSLSVTDDDLSTGVKSSQIQVASPQGASIAAGTDLRAIGQRSDLSESARSSINSAITDLFGSLTGQTKAGAIELLGAGSLDTGLDKIKHALTMLTGIQSLPSDLNLTQIKTFLAVTSRSVALGETARARAIATKPDQKAAVQGAVNLIAAADGFLQDGLHIKAAERYLAAVVKVKNIR